MLLSRFSAVFGTGEGAEWTWPVIDALSGATAVLIVIFGAIGIGVGIVALMSLMQPYDGSDRP